MIITLPLDLSSQFGLIRRGKCEIRKYKLSVCTVWLVSQWSSSLLSSLFTSRDQGQAAALQIWNFVVFAMTDQGGGGGGNKREVWREILEKQISPGQVCRAGGGERGPGHLAGSDWRVMEGERHIDWDTERTEEHWALSPPLRQWLWLYGDTAGGERLQAPSYPLW